MHVNEDGVSPRALLASSCAVFSRSLRSLLHDKSAKSQLYRPRRVGRPCFVVERRTVVFIERKNWERLGSAKIWFKQQSRDQPSGSSAHGIKKPFPSLDRAISHGE